MRVIGTRHGEKLYESLLSREEMARVEEMEGYFQVPADMRDLNYSKYFTVGEERISGLDDYTSHNTQRLGTEQIRELLLELEFIQQELRA